MVKKTSISNEKGGVLLITLVIISISIVTMMTVATLQLAETARNASRVHESYKYMNVMESMSQTIGRARMLGKAVDDSTASGGSVTCTQLASGTTSTTVGGKTLCLPAATVTGICIDWDNNSSTTNDIFCLQTLTVVAENKNVYFDPNKMIAEEKSFFWKTVHALNEMVSMAIAHATCSGMHQWNSPCVSPSATDSTTPVTSYIVTQSVPPFFTSIPSGTATQITSGSGAATQRANMESWTPYGYTWTNTNEVYTPACTASNEYWLGCMSCDTAINPTVTCIEMTMCPPSNSSCAAADRYAQTIAIY
ncbi:MAG: hypothetical protein H6623_08595 [Bdellovibrionaceae bacterium]|nr:hypothetical protein [Pseudobdellovibrionaceae bacterium]